MIARRGFLASLAGLVAAPFVARLPDIPALPPPWRFANRIIPPPAGVNYDIVRLMCDRNVLLTLDDYAGVPTLNFRGIPIKLTEDAHAQEV